jgi:hypothetical protein
VIFVNIFQIPVVKNAVAPGTAAKASRVVQNADNLLNRAARWKDPTVARLVRLENRDRPFAFSTVKISLKSGVAM